MWWRDLADASLRCGGCGSRVDARMACLAGLWGEVCFRENRQISRPIGLVARMSVDAASSSMLLNF